MTDLATATRILDIRYAGQGIDYDLVLRLARENTAEWLRICAIEADGNSMAAAEAADTCLDSGDFGAARNFRAECYNEATRADTLRAAIEIIEFAS